jgi:hypothetical protein
MASKLEEVVVILGIDDMVQLERLWALRVGRKEKGDSKSGDEEVLGLVLLVCFSRVTQTVLFSRSPVGHPGWGLIVG